MGLMKYQVTLPNQVFAGDDAIGNLSRIVQSAKKIALFADLGVYNAGLVDNVIKQIVSQGVPYELLTELPPEPTQAQAQKAIDRFRAMQADLIVAVGGGSVMDVAKLASVLATDAYTLADLLENPQQAKKQVKTVMIPTTAGTGSEATPNSIVTVVEKNLKVGIVNNAMIADYVILEHSFLAGLPKHIIASTGVDALAHAVECYTSNKANPFSNIYALEAAKLIFQNLETLYADPSNVKAQKNMLLGSFYAGIAIACSGTTAVHALAYPLGGKFHIPHGVSNAVLLAQVIRFNQSACERELSEIADVIRPEMYAATNREKSDFVIERIAQIVKNCEIPTNVNQYGVTADDLDFLVEAGSGVTRLLNNNKKQLSRDDIRTLYLSIL